MASRKWKMTDAAAKRVCVDLASVMAETHGLTYDTVVECLEKDGFARPAEEVTDLMSTLRNFGADTHQGFMAYRIGACAAEELRWRLEELARVRGAVQTLVSLAQSEGA